uniref:Uncharacterized protein n=1 Tax=Anguilla anguilla TaxID=7936 RepID=A0A0E9VQZ4_ANGAN
MPYLLIWITWLIIPKTLSGILLKINYKRKRQATTLVTHSSYYKSHL